MMEEKGEKCPRCLTGNMDAPALSRHDEETLICNECGEEEAYINCAGQDRAKVTPEMIEREKRIPLKKPGRWFAYWPDSVRPVWLENILLGHGDPDLN
jgi:hypothetical protein